MNRNRSNISLTSTWKNSKEIEKNKEAKPTTRVKKKKRKKEIQKRKGRKSGLKRKRKSRRSGISQRLSYIVLDISFDVNRNASQPPISPPTGRSKISPHPRIVTPPSGPSGCSAALRKKNTVNRALGKEATSQMVPDM